jgi:hypothetical protein
MKNGGHLLPHKEGITCCATTRRKSIFYQLKREGHLLPNEERRESCRKVGHFVKHEGYFVPAEERRASCAN